MKDNILIYDYGNCLSAVLNNDSGFDKEDVTDLSSKYENLISHIFDGENSEINAICTLLSDTEINNINKTAKHIRENFDNFVVLGIGGSALSARALFNAFKPIYFNLADKAKRDAPRFFVEDNIDPERLNSLLGILDLRKTCFCVVSKSGNTVETLSQFYTIRNLVESVTGAGWTDNFVVITEENNGKLNNFATENNITKFNVPKHLGGRFSVFSAVGMLPAAVLNLNIREMLKGANELISIAKQTDIWKNAPYLSAALGYLNYLNDKKIAVMLPYSESLFSFGEWYCQLFGESLGRRANADSSVKYLGVTPISVLGSTSQHSQFQLYLEGPFDKTFTFIAIKNFRKELKLPSELNTLFDKDVTLNRSFGDLLNIERAASTIALTSFNRPNETITVSELNENTLGKLFMFFIMKTVFLAGFMNVTPFGQPAVESIKISIRSLLNSNADSLNDDIIYI